MRDFVWRAPCAGLLLSCMVVAGHAQDRSADPAIPEIIVTTRGKEEKLQEVPIAITAITDDKLAANGIRDVQDLTKLSPSFNFKEGLSQNDVRITIRGINNQRGRSNVAFLIDGVDVTSENTGTNAGSPLLVNQRLLNDIERVEIVRGSQSALFGRSAFAGAISYVTKEPGAEFESKLGLQAAQYGGLETSGTVSMPLIGETLGLRLNGVWWTDDGAYTNAVSGENVGGGDGRAFAGTLVFRPTDDLKLKTRVTWSSDNYAIRPVAEIRPENIQRLFVPPEALQAPAITTETFVDVARELGTAEGLEIRASEDPLTGGEYPGNNLEVFRATLLAEWRLGDYLLNSYTGITDADLSQRYDLDRQAIGRPDRIFAHNEVDALDSTEQFSQELRVTTDWDGPLTLYGGGLYWTEDRIQLSRNIIVVCSALVAPGANVCRDPDPRQAGVTANAPYTSWQEIYRDIVALDPNTRIPTKAETDHWSLYARADWKFTDTLTLTAETRYSQERFFGLISTGSTCNNFYPLGGPVGFGPSVPIPVLEEQERNFGCGVLPPQSDVVRTAFFTPRVLLSWQATEDALLYASVAKGEKPGGISLVVIPAPIPQPIESFLFEPEKLWSYELGAKTEWEGAFGSLIANTALFYMDYTDKQVTTLQSVLGIPVPVASNAGAWVLGAEIETLWNTPIDGLSLATSYTWLETEYDDFTDLTSSAVTIATLGECKRVVSNLGNRCEVSYNGNRLEEAPRHAFAVQLGYRVPVGDSGMKLVTNLDGRYQGELFVSSNNFTVQEAFWLWDFRIGVERDDVKLSVFVDNLLDDDTIRGGISGPDFGAAVVDAGLITSPPFQNLATLPKPRTYGMRLSFGF